MRLKVDFVEGGIIRPGAINLGYVVFHRAAGDNLVHVHLATGHSALLSVAIEDFDEAIEEFDLLKDGGDEYDDELPEDRY